MATRAQRAAPFSAFHEVPELVGSPTGDDLPTWISPDGCVLYLESGRDSAQNVYHLYVAKKP